MEVEQASTSIDALIERRARGRNEANEAAALVAASERRHREKRQRENAAAWADYYQQLALVHSALAAEHAAKAEALAGRREAC